MPDEVTRENNPFWRYDQPGAPIDPRYHTEWDCFTAAYLLGVENAQPELKDDPWLRELWGAYHDGQASAREHPEDDDLEAVLRGLTACLRTIHALADDFSPIEQQMAALQGYRQVVEERTGRSMVTPELRQQIDDFERERADRRKGNKASMALLMSGLPELRGRSDELDKRPEGE